MSIDYHEQRFVSFKVTADNKVPVSLEAGGPVPASNRPSTWSKREDVEAFIAKQVPADGVRYFVAEALQYGDVFVDVDRAFDPATGELSEFAQELIETVQMAGYGCQDCRRSANGSLHITFKVADPSLMGFGKLPDYKGMDFEEDFPQQHVEIFSQKIDGTSGRFRIIGNEAVEGANINASEEDQIALWEHLVEQFDMANEIANAFRKQDFDSSTSESSGRGTIEFAAKQEHCTIGDYTIEIDVPCSIEEAALNLLEEKVIEFSMCKGDHWQESVFKTAAWAFRSLSSTIPVQALSKWIIQRVEQCHDDNGDKAPFVSKLKSRLKKLWETESQRLTPIDWIEREKPMLSAYWYTSNPSSVRMGWLTGIDGGTVEEIKESFSRQMEGDYTDDEIRAEADSCRVFGGDYTDNASYDFSKWANRTNCYIGDMFREMSVDSKAPSALIAAQAFAMVNSVMTGVVACSDTTADQHRDELDHMRNKQGRNGLGITQVTHPQLAMMLLADTGAGKKGFIDQVQRAMSTAGMQSHCYNTMLGSAQGLGTALQQEGAEMIRFISDEVQNKLFPENYTQQADDFGGFIKELSTANGGIVRPSCIKDMSKNDPIPRCCPSFYFCSQTEVVARRVKPEKMIDGFMGRFLVWECPSQSGPVKRKRIGRTRSLAQNDLPESWYKFLEQWNFIERIDGRIIGSMPPMTINMDDLQRNGLFHFTPDAMVLYEDLVEELQNRKFSSTDETGNLWMRVGEKITVIAMTFAMANKRNSKDGIKVIRFRDVKEAGELLTYFIESVQRKVMAAASTEEGEWANKIIHTISNAGASRLNKDGGMTDKVLRDRTRASKKSDGRLYEVAISSLLREQALFNVPNRSGSPVYYPPVNYHRLVVNGKVPNADAGQKKKSERILAELEDGECS